MNPTLPFQLKNGQVWIAAHVNGHQLNGILDSDSDETFLDARAAARLGLGKETVHSKPVADEVERTNPDSISFDLGPSTLVSSRPRILPAEIQFPAMDFIMGFDALGKSPFTVDYSKSLIRLGAVPSGQKFPFLSGRDVPSAHITFSGVGINGVVDTGAPAGLDLPFAWVKSKLPTVQFQPAVERTDLGPKFESLPFTLSEVLIGGTMLSKVKAGAVRRKDNPLEAGDDWATVGNHILSRFSRVGIDGPGRSCVFIN